MVKILYVEDNEDNVYMRKRRLARKGFEVMIMGDGIAGMAIAHSETPDLILMDLSLPKMDGWAATQAIKADPVTQRLPVIALSAHAMEEHKESALQAGCDDYDKKPVDLPRLMAKINAALRRRND